VRDAVVDVEAIRVPVAKLKSLRTEVKELRGEGGTVQDDGLGGSESIGRNSILGVVGYCLCHYGYNLITSHHIT
jgi:hypothetical protein